jgi:3-hydroxybutyryl-CoA dehydrogenase
MQAIEIQTVGIAGAGTMGQGIAQVFASAGYGVILFDISTNMLDKAKVLIDKSLSVAVDKGKISDLDKLRALERISYTNTIEDLKAELILEAIVEKLEAKVALFKTLESINTAQCIFASNTSSIPITQIAAPLQNPARVVGLHFFNPAQIMKLVEIIAGAATSPEIVILMQELCKKLGKVAVLAKDSPGFIVNRVARHFYVESLKLLEEQVCTVEGIDKLMLSCGFKMGPFQLMDLIGVDTNFSVTTSMYHAFHQDPKFRPSRIQQQKVDAGFHGRKSGKGFYDYPKK